MTTAIRRSDSLVAPDLFQYHDHFTFLATIGETKSSQVFKVAHRQSGEVFAVKRSRKRFRSKLQRERCLREIQMVASLPEMENIVAQYRAWQEGGHFYIQMDYCDGGSLQQYLERQEGGKLVHAGAKSSALWEVVRDVSAGLKFLHANNVLHLDIKPENIYTKKNSSVWKIGDFGLAIGKETTDWEEGDGDYVAPELLRAATEQPHPAADVFSLGATIYQCATGKKLPRCVGSPNADISGLLESAKDGGAAVNDDVCTLLRAMTLPDPRMRPSASQTLAYAEAVLGGDVTRPSLKAVCVDGGHTIGVEGKALAFGASKFDSVQEEIGDIADIDDALDQDGEVGEVGDVNDIDTSRSCGPHSLRDDLATSAEPPCPSNPTDTLAYPPKLPLLNLKSKGVNNGNGGLSSASNSFRIMRRDTNRDSDSDFGSFCDTERTMTTTTDMCDVQCQDDLNDMGDGGLFGPLSSRLLRGHGSLTFDLASPDVQLDRSDTDRMCGDDSGGGCGQSDGCDDPLAPGRQEVLKPSKGHKSQSRIGHLQERMEAARYTINHDDAENGMTHQHPKTKGIQNQAQATSKSHRVGLTVWNEFDSGTDGGDVAKRYRSPFADGSERPLVTNDVTMDKENATATTRRIVTRMTPIVREKTNTASAKSGGKKKLPPPVPLLPIQSNKLASKQNFGKKRQHSYRNSSRSGRSSHRSNSNDVNLSARSMDVLMPPKKRMEYEQAGVSIESLHGELSARMKI